LGEAMLLSEIVRASDEVRSTSSRLGKIASLKTLLKRLDSLEITTGVHYLSGQLLQGRIGVGGALLHAMRSVPPAGQPTLSLLDVDERLTAMAGLKGAGASAKRKQRLAKLFESATAAEQQFLLRLLSGELRQGALEGVMLEALAEAAGEGVHASMVRRALMMSGDLGAVARAALVEGSAGLMRFKVQLLKPLRPMLAQPANDVADALAQLGTVGFEYKVDGARVQIHKLGEEVRVYTRHLKEVTGSVAEVVELVRGLPFESLILEGEVVALSDEGRPHPFQVTMRRFGRRSDLERQRLALPLSAFFFDCLYRDGADLLDRPTEARWRALTEILPADVCVRRCVTAEVSAAESFLQQALAEGHEGVMAKALDAPYQAGERANRWLKIKPAHTLDLTVLAAEWGNGRRRGWLSNLHLGARDPATGQFVMLGKTFKGMTDDMLAWQTQRLQQLAVRSEAHTVYVRPELVVEVAFNNVQVSSEYPGGLALRFARVKRYRNDKSVDEIDTVDTVRQLGAMTSKDKAVITE
jgi:DNA ligase 1